MERRRMMRQKMGQPPAPPQALTTSMRQPPRAGTGRRPPPRISSGIADRFPDVLLPPAPARKPVVRQQAPPRQQPTRPLVQPRAVSKRQKSRPVPPPLPTRGSIEPPRPATASAPPPPVPAVPPQAPASPRISAQALSRWLTPQTLHQQFMLTEIFQPPIALREQHL
jgi:hypothetical protein